MMDIEWRLHFPHPHSTIRCRSWIAAVLLALIAATSGHGVGHASPAQQTDPVPIYAIQGTGAETPYAETRIDTFGVVTALLDDGFYLQDAAGDGDPQTSDGLFVYTGRPPTAALGSCIEVNNVLVQEFYEKTELSQLSSRSIQPSQRCGTAPVAPTPIELPRLRSDPAEAYEPVEGMLVELDSFRGVVHGPTKRFADGEAEIALVHEPISPHIHGGRLFQHQAEYTSALIFLSSALGTDLPDAGWGDRVEVTARDGGPVLAVLDYNFGKYQFILLPGQDVRIVEEFAFADASAPTASDDDFTVCTFNLKGMGRGSAQITDDDEYEDELHKRALAIAESLQGCTIIGLQETGTPGDAANLAALLRDEFDLDYGTVAIPGPMTNHAEFPLTLSALVRNHRVEIVDAALRQGCSPEDYEVVETEDAADSCPPQQYPLFNRPPLIIDVAVQGDWGDPYELTLIDNHWKSKGGDESVNSARRRAQAQHVADLVQERLDENPDARVIVLGDLNDYYDSEPVALLRRSTEPAMVHAFDYLPPIDRYTYTFNGASQVLDHILVTANMAHEIAEVDPVHINADYPYPLLLDRESVHHSSDHDPVAVRIRPGGSGWIGGSLSFADIGVRLTDAAGDTVASTETDALGHFRFWNVTPGAYTLSYSPPAHIELAAQETPMQVAIGANLAGVPAAVHGTVVTGAAAAQLTHALGEYVSK